MKARTVRATDAERAAYAATRPVYPLWGFVLVNGTRCVVEDMRGAGWEKGEPAYEIRAPRGHIFAPDYVHGLLCDTLADVADRASYQTAELCTCAECAAINAPAPPAAPIDPAAEARAEMTRRLVALDVRNAREGRRLACRLQRQANASRGDARDCLERAAYRERGNAMAAIHRARLRKAGALCTMPPALEHDARMRAEFGSQVGERGRLERAIAWNMCEHMARAGWRVVRVHDGEESTKTADTLAALELVFNLDIAWLTFRKGDDKHTVMLVLGNGQDIISDWSYSEGDADGFNRTLSRFMPDAVAPALLGGAL